MARFILDVHTKGDEDSIEAVLKAVKEALAFSMITVHCIDKTNENQFYSDYDDGTNKLTWDQITRYHEVCDK